MTVETQTIQEDYIGDGKNRSFWYHGRVITDTDVVPYINEVSGTMPFGTTLQNDGHNGVLILFTTAPIAGAAVSLRLEVPATQEQHYVENNPFPSETLEDAIDKLTLLYQQLKSSISYNNSRTERVPRLDAPITEELTAVLRAGKWRTWDVFGQPSSTANPSLFPTGSAIFDSVALLRAAPTPSAAGGYFITKGALNSGDGGANIWEWSVASTATDDVGTFVRPNAVNPANPGRYVSIYQGKRNVRQYGAIADGVTNALPQFVACAAANPGFTVPAGSYMLASAFNLPAFCSMTVFGRILGPGGTVPNVRVNGGVVDDSLGTDVTNGVPGNYSTYPVGSTVFTGPFQAAGFQVGDAVGVERGTTSIANSVINQCARDFNNVVALTSTTMTISGGGTRFAYDVPRIARVPWLPYVGSLIGYGAGVGAIGTRFIAGNYTSIIQAGDVIQIENIAGTDTWYGNAFYNERVRCKSITSAGIVLENMLANSYTNPQIVRTRSIEGISIDGTGFIDFFEGYNAGTFKAEKLSFRAFSLAWSDGGLVNQISVDSDLPRAAGLTWCRNFIVSDVISKNAFAVTDNAAFKSLGCWDCTFSDIAGYGTSTSNGAGGQTAYPFFVDGLFTPYCGYASGCVFTALNCDVSFSGSVRSAWFGLTRRCRIDGLKGAADLFLDRSMDTHLTDVTIGGSVEFNANTRCTIDADAATFRMRGGFACWFYGTSRGAYGTNNNRCVSIEGSTAVGYEIAKNIGISVRVVGGKSTDVAFHLDHVDGWTMTGCSDAGTYDASSGVLVPTALAKSIDIGSVTSNPRLLGDNILVNPKDFISDWTPTVSGGTVSGAPTYAAFGIYGAFEYSGNFVDVVGGVTWTGAGGATGDIRVLMPFTLKNTPSAQQGVPCVFSGVGATLNQYYLRGNPGDLFLTLFSISALGAEAPVSWATAPTGSIRFSGKYYAQ